MFLSHINGFFPLSLPLPSCLLKISKNLLTKRNYHLLKNFSGVPKTINSYLKRLLKYTSLFKFHICEISLYPQNTEQQMKRRSRYEDPVIFYKVRH